MKEQANDVQKPIRSKDWGWLWSLLSAIIVGVLMLLGQYIIAPKVARDVKKEESILEQRYKAYENAVNIMHRYLASVPITGKNVPQWYNTPPEKTRPTQVETNIAYTLLAIYGKSNTIAEQFYATIGAPEITPADKPSKINPADIVNFVSAVRKELEVDKKGFTGDKFQYIFVRPININVQEDKEPNNEPNHK